MQFFERFLFYNFFTIIIKTIAKVKKKLSTFDSSFSLVERDRIKLIVISSLILIIFWASFEQAGGLMNLYAFEKTDRNLDFINFEVPASWFQSINPLMIILLGFQISAFWVFLAKKKIISSSLFKISVGIIIMGLGGKKLTFFKTI